MKNSMKTMAAMLATGAAFGLGAMQTNGATLTTVTYAWGFATSATPVAPDSAGGGNAQAIVVPGSLAVGWMDSSPILGSAQGIWDLGQAGTVTLNNPEGFGGAVGAQLITVKVTQFQGAFIAK